MKHIGLFEGIGGFSLAARWAGWETIAWCEWNDFGQKILKHHFPKANAHGDITKTDFTIYRGQCDIITGGFPCQPYSLAGKRKGKDDERHLWPEMLRAIKEIQPRWVVGENVYGLVNWSGGLVFNEVQSDLEAAGYEVFPYVLPACAVNAPHRRDRVWFVAYAGHNSTGKAGNSGANEGTETTFIHSAGQGGDGETILDSGFCDLSWTPPDTDSIGMSGQPTDPGTIKKTGQGRESVAQDGNTWNVRRWEGFPTTEPTIRRRDDGLSSRLDGITFSKWRNESIKAAGNAIVPQVAYQIFKTINQYIKCNQTT